MAWSLKASVDVLNTGEFIVAAVGQSIEPSIFPALIFLISAVTALTIGTSFGTMGIILPIAVPLAFTLDGSQYGLITVMSMAAVLDGAIFGDHCSPLSDTTIMSSLSSGCDHIHHVKTQLPYAVTVGLTAAFCCYYPAALGLSNGWGILLGLMVFLAILLCIGKPVKGQLIQSSHTP
jgi:Na+/H+ antiporter NhaC